MEKLFQDLEKGSNTLFKWFTEILLKANPSKSYFRNKTKIENQINIGGMTISNCKYENVWESKTSYKVDALQELHVL